MALNVITETNVAMTAGVNAQVIGTNVGRKGLSMQLQGGGFYWIKLTGAASKNDGFRSHGWEILVMDGGVPGNGNNVEFYEGAIEVFWEGGPVDPATNQRQTSANMRIAEVE